MKLRVLDLFSGIGGFSLGLEKTGHFETVAFCEIEKFPRKILGKHWPGVPVYDDVKTLTVERLAADGISVDVICGGFPCQDISNAGKGAGLAGERSGLWFQFHRLIAEINPRWVIIENVSALRSRGLDAVLGSLSQIGYNAEWHCIPASAVGAPHQRDRIWIVAHPNCERVEPDQRGSGSSGSPEATPSGTLDTHVSGLCRGGPWEPDVADANLSRCGESHKALEGRPSEQPDGCGLQPRANVPDADDTRLQGWLQDGIAHSQGWEEPCDGRPSECGPRWRRGRDGQWTTEPQVGRVADGFPGRVDQLKALGNAVVPQIPELIGEAIIASEMYTRSN